MADKLIMCFVLVSYRLQANSLSSCPHYDCHVDSVCSVKYIGTRELLFWFPECEFGVSFIFMKVLYLDIWMFLWAIPSSRTVSLSRCTAQQLLRYKIIVIAIRRTSEWMRFRARNQKQQCLPETKQYYWACLQKQGIFFKNYAQENSRLFKTHN